MKISSPRLAIGLGIFAFVVAAGAELGALRHYQSANRRADVRWRRAERELDRIRQSRPAPTEASSHALEIEVEELQHTLASLELTFATAASKRDQATPNRPADLFFELGALVEALGARARTLNVGLAREASGFGFSAYAREGPEPARGGAVRRQMEIVRQLVDALLASRPEAILSVQREMPLTDAERQSRHAPLKRGDRASPPASRMSARESADYFAIDPRWSVFAAGAVDTLAFRLVFVGSTEVLQTFLAAVPAGNPALVIRSIEVEQAPVTAEGSVKPAKGELPPSVVLQENAPAPRPTVLPVNRDLKFAVIVEHIDLVLSARSDEGKPGT